IAPAFFFFQAEDGIRVFHVTGVQTCALPICGHSTKRILPLHDRAGKGGRGCTPAVPVMLPSCFIHVPVTQASPSINTRPSFSAPGKRPGAGDGRVSPYNNSRKETFVYHQRMLKGAGTTLLIGACMLPATAPAADDAMQDLLRILREKGSITQEEFELLQNAAEADAEKAKAESEKLKAAAEALPKIETKDRIVIGSRDGAFEWQPIGRVMADYIWTDADQTEL